MQIMHMYLESENSHSVKIKHHLTMASQGGEEKTGKGIELSQN
jgi:hypothetical protein